jgi:hypothetical protein
MQEKDTKEDKKHPADMTTDEALDYAFGPEIAEALRREAAKDESPEECQSEEPEV